MREVWVIADREQPEDGVKRLFDLVWARSGLVDLKVAKARKIGERASGVKVVEPRREDEVRVVSRSGGGGRVQPGHQGAPSTVKSL